MFRKDKDINDICQEREQLLSQLRRSKRMKIMDEKRNNIILYNSLKELLNAHPDLKESKCYSSCCFEHIRDCWEESIACILTLKSNHFLMTNVDEFEEITDIISNFDNYKYVIIIAHHKYIYIDNQFDLCNLIENSSDFFKWWDNKNELLRQTYHEYLCYSYGEVVARKYTKFLTNILAEAFNYIQQNYDNYHIPILLELDVTDGCSNYDVIRDDNKKYEVINEIDLLNQNFTILKNSVDLNQRKYVGAIFEIDPDEVSDSEDYDDYHKLVLIQLYDLEQLGYLKRYVDCGPYVYKTI